MYQPHYQAAPPPTYVEHYSALSYTLTDHGYRSTTSTVPVVPVQTLRFDDQQELLWSGNVYGHVTSYYSEQLTKYTSFSVGYADPVLNILTGDFGVLCLLKDELKLRNRRGIPKLSYSSSTFKDMLCMTMLPSELILLGGLSHNLIEFDLERQRQLRTTELSQGEVGCCLVRQHPKFVCCADLEGRITLRNTNNLSVSKTFKTHGGQIADFDVHGNYLVTCGYPANRPQPDRLVMVYDLRTFRLVTPIQPLFAPYLLKFIPAFTSKFCITSALGEFQLLDVSAPAAENCTAFTHHVQMQSDSSLTSIAVSSSGQALAFGDDYGRIHLFGTNTDVAFNQLSSPIESADALEPVPYIDPNDFITSLSAVPTAYTYDPLEKSLGDDLKTETTQFYKTPKIDDMILKNMTTSNDVGYSQNPYKSLGRIQYIKGRVGVVGVTHLDDDESEEDPNSQPSRGSEGVDVFKNDQDENSVAPQIQQPITATTSNMAS